MAISLSSFLIFLLSPFLGFLHSPTPSTSNTASSPLTPSSPHLDRHREEIYAIHAAVASDDERCSEAGKEAIRDGGTAVDAAVVVALCLGVVSPASSGIGGGGLMLVRTADGETMAFNMRETAPGKAYLHRYAKNPKLKESGPLSIGVPGEVAGLYEAWKQFGKLPWQKLVQPAIQFAENGFRVSPYLAMQIQSSEREIKQDEGLRRILTSSQGTLLKTGDICKNTKLAETLKKIASNGSFVFYNGSIGSEIVEDVKKLGGILEVEDLGKYRAEVTSPLTANVSGVTILGMPPPSAGGAGLILMMNILANFGIPSGERGPLGAHRLIESLKHFFAIRPNLGDPNFVNNSAVLSDMLSPEFAAKLKNTIDDSKTFDPEYYGDRYVYMFR